MSTSATSEGGRLWVLGLIELAAGLWLLAAPFVLHYPTAYPNQRALLVDLFVGLFVSSLAVLHLLNWRTGRWASRINLVLGLVLAAVPAFLGYTTDPAIRHAGANDLICGLGIVAGAMLSLAGSKEP